MISLVVESTLLRIRARWEPSPSTSILIPWQDTLSVQDSAESMQAAMNEAVKKLIEKIEELKKAVGVKSCIKDYGIDEKDFLDRLDDMTEQPSTTSVPAPTQDILS